MHELFDAENAKDVQEFRSSHKSPPETGYLSAAGFFVLEKSEKEKVTRYCDDIWKKSTK